MSVVLRGHPTSPEVRVKALVYGGLAVLAVIAVLVAVYRAGVAVGRSHSYRAQLRRAGIDRGTVRRYVAAARILERLAGDRDVTGLMAGDTLSPETHSMVASWVTEHRKETHKT